jgi:MFS family permease
MKPRSHALKKATFAGFWFSLHVASTLYLHSSFLAERMSDQVVGLLYVCSAFVGLFGMIWVPRMLSRIGFRGGASVLLATSLGSLLVMTAHVPLWAQALAFILYFATNTLVFLSLDIAIEHWGSDRHMGRIRGLYLTLCNFGFMIAPIVSGFLVDRLGYSLMYRAVALLIVPTLFLVGITSPGFRPKATGTQHNLVPRYIAFLKTKDLRNVYIANFILQFFYAWMVVYTPLYLHEYLGFGWDRIGLLFTIMLSAFVLLQAPLGYLADRFLGERKLLMIGFVIMGLATLLLGLYAVRTTPFITLAVVLFLTRVGASIVEVMTESYFFKYVPEHDASSIGFFRNTYPLAYIIAPLLGSLILAVGSLQTLFILLGFICMAGILASLKLKKKR